MHTDSSDSCCAFSLRIWLLTVVLSYCALTSGQDLNELRTLKGEFNQFMQKSQFREAEQRASRIVEIADSSFSSRPDVVAEALYMHGMVLFQLSRYAEAERVMERQIGTIENLSEGAFKEKSTAWAANNLALAQQALGKLPPAERRFREAARLFEKLEGGESAPLGAALHNLGNLYRTQGQYLEAEYLQRRALAIRRKSYGDDHVIVAGSMDDLGRTLRDQHRDVDAEELFRQALTIFKKVSPQSPALAICLNNLGNLYVKQQRLNEAEPLFQQALKIWQTVLGKDSQDVAWTLSYLARLEISRGQLKEAKLYTLDCRRILERLWGERHPDLAVASGLELELLRLSGEMDQAEQMASNLIEIHEQFQSAAVERASAYGTRAKLRWLRGDHAGAFADMQLALRQAVIQQGLSSGTDYERGVFFLDFADLFETMLGWQIETGDVEGAYETLERSRAAVLRKQLAASLTDPLRNAEPSEAQRLRKTEATAREGLTDAKSQLDDALRQKSSDGGPSSAELLRLSEQVREAQRKLVSVEAEILAASPEYRTSLSRIEDVWSLPELKAHLEQQNAVLLAYAVGRSGGHVLIVSGQSEPRIEPLTVTADAAAILKITSGPLTADRCRLALCNKERTGIYQQLSKSEKVPSEDFLARLAVLSHILLPESLRTDLSNGRNQQLIVAPDSAVALLPFETLIPGDAASDRYLLDLTGPVTYTPSATVLRVLLEVDRNDAPESDGSILSVGDPEYTVSTGDATSTSQLMLYRSLGSALNNLNSAGTECTWLADSFQDQQIPITTLTKLKATEQAVRNAVSRKQLIHFACHGFADDRLGNSYGALALTPGRSSSDLSDDGFLTLAEISQLDLRSCELAILSACETNAGPEQQGEGVWALSRGFLIAGARRVVATDWMVDDNAAASLVSYFCAGVARDWKKPAGPNYARRLHDAKRWVRQQDQWSSPYYWGGFVLVGPP